MSKYAPSRYQGHNTLDSAGPVRVVVLRYDRRTQAPVKGNIVRTVTVQTAKVSEIVERVKEAIFR